MMNILVVRDEQGRELGRRTTPRPYTHAVVGRCRPWSPSPAGLLPLGPVRVLSFHASEHLAIRAASSYRASRSMENVAVRPVEVLRAVAERGPMSAATKAIRRARKAAKNAAAWSRPAEYTPYMRTRAQIGEAATEAAREARHAAHCGHLARPDLRTDDGRPETFESEALGRVTIPE